MTVSSTPLLAWASRSANWPALIRTVGAGVIGEHDTLLGRGELITDLDGFMALADLLTSSTACRALARRDITEMVSMLDDLASLQEAAAACQDLAREVAMLRHAA